LLLFLVASMVISTAHATVIPNGLSHNSLNFNGVQINGVQINGVQINGVQINGIQLNGIQLNGLSTNQLTSNALTFNGLYFNDTALGNVNFSSVSSKDVNGPPTIDLVHYLVVCSLPAGQQWTAQYADEAVQYNGGFGLAPYYVDRPLSVIEQGWMSACLLAHVNAFGKHILISVRNDPKVGASPSEMQDFPVFEGAFFGSLFSPNVTAFSCQGEPEIQALGESPDRQWRACTDFFHDNCPHSIGYCADYCSIYTPKFGFARCDFNGTEYDQVLNVYLRASGGRIQQSLIVLVIVVISSIFF